MALWFELSNLTRNLAGTSLKPTDNISVTRIGFYLLKQRFLNLFWSFFHGLQSCTLFNMSTIGQWTWENTVQRNNWFKRNHTRRKNGTALDNSCRIKWKNLVSLPKNGPIWLKSERRLVQLLKENTTREKFCSGPVWMGFIYCCLKVKNNLSSCSITVRPDNSFLLKDNWSF